MTEVSTSSIDRPGKLGPGRLVLVVGPSGAGKDTLLNLARSECAGDDRIVFPRRVVTRQASPFEDNEEMDAASFRDALAGGTFALHWDAHGHFYGVRHAINDEIVAGRTVVVNVSRTVIPSARRDYADVIVVAITAPADVLAARLGQRHRASDGDIGERLHRSVNEEAVAADVTIVNVGDPGPHGHRLAELIRRPGGTALNGSAGDRIDVDHQHG